MDPTILVADDDFERQTRVQTQGGPRTIVAFGDFIGFPGCTPQVPLSSIVLRAHCG